MASAVSPVCHGRAVRRGHDWMMVTDEELRADGPSYTADTLERLRGVRARADRRFSSSPALTRSQKLGPGIAIPDVLDLANFVVVSRPGVPVAALGRPTAVVDNRDACRPRRRAPAATAGRLFSSLTRRRRTCRPRKSGVGSLRASRSRAWCCPVVEQHIHTAPVVRTR